MHEAHTKYRSAFTLVEMILVIGMMAVISLAMVGVVRSTYQNWETLNNRSSLLLDGQAVIQQMVRILRQAKAITAVSQSTDQAGYITFTGVNDTTEEFRLDTTTGELLYGDPNALQVLAAPVSSLVFECYDAGLVLLAGPLDAEDTEDIRTVAFEATFVNPDDGTLAVTLAGRIFIPTSAVVDDPPTGGLLFVVNNDASLTAQENVRKTLLEGWGYSVSLISDDAAQAVFDTVVANADVVYVPALVDGNQLASKLRGKAIGIVNEDGKNRNALGIAGSEVYGTLTDLDVTDNTHYITSPFGIGALAVYTAVSENSSMGDSIAPDLTTLLDDGGPVTPNPAVGVLETGAQLNDGGSAAGRRVHLPWGDKTFDINALTADGQTILRRSIEWAAVSAASPTALLFVAADGASLTAQETARKDLIESWDYAVSLISDDASQGEFDTAVADADVAYVSGDIDALSLSTKLTGATIGIVNEEGQSADELGLGDGLQSNEFIRISVVDNSHYITQGFSMGWLEIIPSNQPLQALKGGVADGIEELAQVWITGAQYDPGLLVLETGAALYGGGTAAARRVELPWGGSEFDINNLNADGQTVMRRAIEWAAAGSGAVVPDPEMYVHDITMAWRKQGPRYYGQATVWVKDADGNDVEGATVNGTWSGSVSGTDSGDTAADGTVMAESSGVNGGGTYIFTVDSITKTGFTYNSALDVESSGMIVAP